MRLGAVVLALLTVAAVVFAVLNFQQRSSFVLPDDGVTWMDNISGVTAWHIVKDSPAAKAGIKQGDIVDTVRGFTIHRATDVTRMLFRVGSLDGNSLPVAPRRPRLRNSPGHRAAGQFVLHRKLSAGHRACSIFSSACSFSSAAGTRPAPSISIFSVWFRSFFTASTTAAN